MNVGRAVAAGIAGLFLFFFLAVDLVLFGALPLNSVLVTILPLVGLVLGAVAGALVPRRVAPPLAPVGPVAPPAPAPASAPVPGGIAPRPGPVGAAPSGGTYPSTGPGFRPTHTVPLGGLPTWPVPDANAPANGALDPGLPVRVVGRAGDWAQVHCENGWEAWVNGRSLVPGP